MSYEPMVTLTESQQLRRIRKINRAKGLARVRAENRARRARLFAAAARRALAGSIGAALR